jgi:DNA transformation protein and related proteins
MLDLRLHVGSERLIFATVGDLRSVGAVTAYERICGKHPGETIPVCYYLYSLEGALRGQH